MEEKSYKGIKGWMVVLIINLILFGFVYINGITNLILSNYAPVRDWGYAGYLLDAGKWFSLISEVVLLLVLLCLFFLIASKKALFKPWCIIFFILVFCFKLILSIMIFQVTPAPPFWVLQQSIAYVVNTGVLALLWIAYLIRSKRVAQTFTK